MNIIRVTLEVGEDTPTFIAEFKHEAKLIRIKSVNILDESSFELRSQISLTIPSLL